MRCAQLEQYLIRRRHSKRHTKRGIQIAFAMFLHPVSDDTSHLVSPNTVQIFLCTNPRPQNSIEVISSDRRSQCPRIPLVIDYHPGLPDISGILRKYHPLLLRSDRLRLVLLEVPIITFCRPPNSRNTLVRAMLDLVERILPVVGPRQKSWCQICPLVVSEHVGTSCWTHQKHEIHCDVKL